MKLDKTKKYEFCGEVFTHNSVCWEGSDWGYVNERFQLFADYGHVTEIREPLVFEGRVMIDNDGDPCGLIDLMRRDDTRGKTFRVTWTEVVK